MSSTDALYRQIDAIRSDKLHITNLYISSSLIEQYLEANKIEFFIFDHECVLLKDEGEFYRLYFVALPNQLFGQSASIAKIRAQRKPIVSDIIVPFQDIPSVAMHRGGFSLYSYHHRMIRTAAEAATTPSFTFGEMADADVIMRILSQNFDPLKEHLPTSEEIERAILAQQILVIKREGNISLLNFMTRGVVSELKYLFIHSAHRGKGLSQELLDSYLALNQTAKTFFLWVEGANYTAQNIYLKNQYKYAPLCNFTFYKH